MGNFCMSDLGVNGIADRKHKNFLPRVSIFAQGPEGPAGENGDPWEKIFYA